MTSEQTLSELKHAAEAARGIGCTIAVPFGCVTLLELLAEIENHRLAALVYERKQLHPSERD